MSEFDVDWITPWDYTEYRERMPDPFVYPQEEDDPQFQDDMLMWGQESHVVQLSRKSHDTPENRELWAQELTPNKTQKRPVSYLMKALKSGEGGGAILYGGVGVGKSRLAGRCIHVLRASLLPTAYAKAAVLLDDLRDKATSEDRTESLPALRGRFASAPALVIDDLGAARSTEFAIEQWTSLFDERHELAEEAPLITIITTNFNPPALESYLGERAFSRLVGLCPEQFPMNGNDLRKEKNG